QPQPKDSYLTELLTILGKTTSFDAFLVTVSVLAETQSDARQVIPTVIRNAERLGIYGQHSLTAETPEGAVAREVTELITRMSKRQPGSDRKQAVGYRQGVQEAAAGEQAPPVMQKISEADGDTKSNDPTVPGEVGHLKLALKKALPTAVIEIVPA